MKPAQWHQIESLYNQALEIEEAQRAAFLREACGSDRDLQRNMEELLAEGPKAESFLEKAALREIAHEFAEAEASTWPSWTGRRVGNYQFLSLLGVGGMGEVYRAHDTKLNVMLPSRSCQAKLPSIRTASAASSAKPKFSPL